VSVPTWPVSLPWNQLATVGRSVGSRQIVPLKSGGRQPTGPWSWCYLCIGPAQASVLFGKKGFAALVQDNAVCTGGVSDTARSEWGVLEFEYPGSSGKAGPPWGLAVPR